MFLEATFDDNPAAQVEVSDNHTIQVIGPGNSVVAAFSVHGLTGLSLQAGTLAPAVPTPATPEPQPEQAPPVDPALAGRVAVIALAGPEAPPQPDPSPEQPATEPADPAVADAALTPESDAHGEAVANATTAIDVAQQVAPEDAARIAAGALADVEAALVLYPDSPQLADAKAQLEQLATPAEPTPTEGS